MRFLHAADLHLDSPLRGLDRYAGAPVDFVLLAVAIHGRSFPDRAVDEDWVPSYPAPVPGCFNIVVLHTSQGGRAGHDTYAPTELATLCAKAYDYWALGHVHARELRTSSRRNRHRRGPGTGLAWRARPAACRGDRSAAGAALQRAGCQCAVRARGAPARQARGGVASTQAALRSRLEGTDAPALEQALTRCRTEITCLTEDVAEARLQEERTRRALETIDASSAAAEAREGMESAAACLRAALRPWARLKLAHMLLEESLARFKERAQAPMVAVASTYFALMTGARYPSLVVDDTQHPPVLRTKRADGQVVGVEGLSEGTRDQLFLALRLAALELRRATPQTPMPLVLDDVLVTSDDARAANVLRALARFAEGGQVLLFTHHQHLVEVARGALGEEGVRGVEL